MSDPVKLPLRAENNPKFYGRFKWLGIGALAFMVYSLYDGFINYPDQLTRSEAFYAIAEEQIPEEDLKAMYADAPYGRGDVYKLMKQRYGKSEELQNVWADRAEAEGWAPEPPTKLRTLGDIYSNYIFAVLGAFAGVWFLTTVARTNGRWFELNEEGIDSRWGESFALDQITAIEKKQWRDKGIAHLRYTDEGGRSKRFVVDNYKYHRPTVDRILYRIEQQVGADKIVNGVPDQDPDAPPAEAAPAPQETDGQPTA